IAAATLALAACGGSSKTSSTAATHQATTASNPAPAVDELSAAVRPTASQFPSAQGKSLQQLAKLADSTAQLGAANGTFTPGFRRLAFALTNSSQQFVYAPTAVYIATSPTAPARGPFLAPADPMTVAPQYRSKQNSAPGGL